MLKAKHNDKKKEHSSPKSKKAIKSTEKPDKIKEKKSAKKLKNAIKDGLVQTPAPEPSKNIVTPAKKVEKSADKKEQKKLKKLEKKLKKAEEKQAPAVENGQSGKKDKASEKGPKPKKDKKETTESSVDTLKKPEQNGTKGEKPVMTLKQKKKQQRLEAAKNKPKAEGKAENTIFVGNLPTNTKRVQVTKHFIPYGNILAIRLRTANGKVIFKHKMRKETGALNAYVIFADADSATKALEANGSDFKGNHLRVTRTEKLEDSVDPKRIVFVGNLRRSCTDEKLRAIFSSCGEIDYVRTLHDSDQQGCSGAAFVSFKTPDAVGLALELKGTMLDERPINVERYMKSKLGAKEKREADNAKGKDKSSKRFKKPEKPDKKGGKPKKEKASADGDAEKKKKKSEFRGVKADDSKKKHKKKPSGDMKKLAKKIAPRSDE